MSQFKVEIVRVGKIGKHPNADTLSVTHVFDFPVVFRTGDFIEGQKAVYVPVDSLVPTDRPEFEFLKEEGKTHARIKAKKLRGIFSMGMIVPICVATFGERCAELGDNVAELLGVTKYEPEVPMHWGGQNERDPGFIPVYTDIDHYRRYPDILQPGENVIVTEKLHGANARFTFHEGRLWVGSHNCIKRDAPESMWWNMARKYQLAERLAKFPGHVFYGEVYGHVQDLKYGSKGPVDTWLRFFDVFKWSTGSYADQDETANIILGLGLNMVPLLYVGGWQPEFILPLADGSTTLGGQCIREGIVIKPAKERRDDRLGRVILKHVSEGYLTRKSGTEYH